MRTKTTDKSVSPGKRLLSRDETASYLGIASKTLDRWAFEGRGPRFRRLSHKCVRYSSEDIEAYLASLETGGTPLRPVASDLA